MKYDFDLSIDEETSLGKIISKVEENASVLEFGPGNGRMTKYLKEEKNCKVSIIEFDEILFQHVMEIAEDGFLGNIEEYKWCEYFPKEQFDYIVFADVLEHLGDSKQALQAAIPYLKPQGKFLITFPNLAHNSVLIDLFNNKLDWGEYGLLDKTHNSFYTDDGFKTWFQEVGLMILTEDYTYSQVGENELPASYDELPLQIQYPFKTRPYGEVYQYFFELGKMEHFIGVAEPQIKDPQNSSHVVKLNLVYDYGEELKIEPVLINNWTGHNKQFTLQVTDPINALKIALDTGACVVACEVRLDGKEFTQFSTNAVWNSDKKFVFLEEDPHFRLEGKDIVNKQIEISLDFKYIGTILDFEQKLIDQLLHQKNEIDVLYQKVDQIKQSSNEKFTVATSRYNELIESKAYHTIQSFSRLLDPFSVTSKQKVQEHIVYNIETVEYDQEINMTIVKGWGFDRQTKKPLLFQLRSDEGLYYRFTHLLRKDVSDTHELLEGEKYGFIMEIENYQIKKNLHVTVDLPNGEKLCLKIDKFNLDNSSLVKRIRIILGKLRRKGLVETIKWLKMRKQDQDAYERWILENEIYDLEKIEKTIATWSWQPKISVVVPVYNVEEKWLEICIASLKKQFYTNWELCLADDCSSQPHIQPMLERYAASDERIKVVFREDNGHISEATNSAIKLATGEFIGFMDNDDELAPNALFEVVQQLNFEPETDFIYSDEDKITTRGKRFDPFFKPNWNSQLLLGHNYITHFVVVSRQLIDQVGGLRTEYNGSQDYDFVLRATEAAQHIVHLPKILYHWRTVETSTASSPETKEYAYTAGKNAIQAALERQNLYGKVTMTSNYGAYKVNYAVNVNPKISIILHGSLEHAERCIREVLEKTSYVEYEIILSDKASSSLVNDRVRYVKEDQLNHIVNYATGDFIVFLNAGCVPENARWLDEMLNYMQDPQTGAVGGKIVNSSNVILEAGISKDNETDQLVLDQRGVLNKSIGYYFRIALPREVFAVSLNCMIVKKIDFIKVKGFSEDVQDEYKGIDLSLKLRSELQLAIVWQPYSILKDPEHNIKEMNSSQVLSAIFATYETESLQDPYWNANKIQTI